MAELAEWSAQALGYQGSDGPVKVMYFRSRAEVGTNDSFDQYYALKSELGEQSISHQVSSVSDIQAVFSGHLFDPVEVLDSKNYKLQGEEYFEDGKSALEDIASKFNNNPRLVPFDLESCYIPKFPYIGPRFIKPSPSKEEDLLWYYFKEYATNARDIKVREERQDGRQTEDNKRKSTKKQKPMVEGKKEMEKNREDAKKKEEDGKKKGKGKGGKDDEEGKEKGEKGKSGKEEIKKEEKTIDKEEDEIRKRKKTKQWLEDFDGAIYQGVRVDSLYAFIFGITTELNPSGMWIVEEFFYDEEEVA